MQTAIKPTFNYTGYGWEGEKYKTYKNLGTVKIAKLIRKELKQKYPKYKFSIRTHLYSSVSSINVEIQKVDFPITTEWYRQYSRNKDNREPFRLWLEKNRTFKDHQDFEENKNTYEYTKEALRFRGEVQKIVDQYNFNDSDGMIDYFHTHYYGFVRYDYQSELNEINQ